MRGMGRIFKRGSVYWIAYSYRNQEYRESAQPIVLGLVQENSFKNVSQTLCFDQLTHRIGKGFSRIIETIIKEAATPY